MISKGSSAPEPFRSSCDIHKGFPFLVFDVKYGLLLDAVLWIMRRSEGWEVTYAIKQRPYSIDESAL